MPVAFWKCRQVIGSTLRRTTSQVAGSPQPGLNAVSPATVGSIPLALLPVSMISDRIPPSSWLNMRPTSARSFFGIAWRSASSAAATASSTSALSLNRAESVGNRSLSVPLSSASPPIETSGSR